MELEKDIGIKKDTGIKKDIGIKKDMDEKTYINEKKDMDRKKYIGHDSQILGVEEFRLTGGRGDGMRLFQVKNGRGLEFTISADRCGDIARLSFRGDNFGYFSPAGYVAPSYYDDKEDGFLKSFTAGFLTTCGLTAVGSPCVDQGVKLPLHGSISNCPAERVSYEITEEEIVWKAVMNQAGIFTDKLMFHRMISCSLSENRITIRDTVENTGSEKSPLMLLYHMNMGYPLLSENARLYLPSDQVVPRNEHAAKGMNSWNQLQMPEAGYVEQCYYHTFGEAGMAAIYNPDIKKGLVIRFDPKVLPCFTQWKMMGVKDYVLGLEPGNCYPDGRDVMRKEGKLKFIEPDEKITYQVEIEILESDSGWEKTGGILC